MLQHEYDQDDFGLKERLSTNPLHTNDQRKRLLGSKVLSLFKKISTNTQLTVKLTIVTRLFAVLEKLTMEMDDFAETIHRFLVYFLIEWHENKVLRQHIMSNFLDLFNHEKVLSLNQVIEPLCSIIAMNLEKEEVDSRKYMNMEDFSFFWALANKNRLVVQSALDICKVMRIFMLKRDPQYRGVAEKIFFKLLSKFPNEDSIRVLLLTHA